MFTMFLPIQGTLVLNAFRQADGSGKVIVILLIVGSIYCSWLWVVNLSNIRKARRESDRFKYQFSRETHPLNLYLQRKKFPDAPLYAIYETACQGIMAELGPAGQNPGDLLRGGIAQDVKLNPLKVDGIRDRIERKMAEEAIKLEGDLSYLGSAINVAPFLGMFGTVLGVMNTFSAIGETGSVVVSEVAPGISSALITTVMGLFVALPASVAYTIISRRVRALAVDMDNFSQEMHSQIRRHYLKDY